MGKIETKRCDSIDQVIEFENECTSKSWIVSEVIRKLETIEVGEGLEPIQVSYYEVKYEKEK